MALDLTISNHDITKLEIELGGKYSFDPERRNVLVNSDDVQACPGSGKTTMVGAKLILHSKNWTDTHKGICVLTHTNVAKEEILKLLIKHPSGHKLLTYPHFVGTIQELVDKFLALPYLRTKYEFKCFSEHDEAKIEILRAESAGFDLNALCKNLYHTCGKANYRDIKSFLSTLHYVNSSFDLAFFGQHGTLKTIKCSKSPRYLMLKDLKEKICRSGVFQFRDMYAFAEKLLLVNSDVKFSLRMRFMDIFIDEMQDTQKFQDELINQIFDCDVVTLQRFGDPDQAIFTGMSGEKPNESYNNNRDLVYITDSHRFGNDVASKIRGLSFNQLPRLISIRENPEGKAPHTIYLYNGQTIHRVIPEFGKLVFENLSEEQRKCVKAVGAVGKSNPQGLTIKHYWDDYDKTKSIKSFKPTRLIHIVKKCSVTPKGDVFENYQQIIQGIVDLLRLANKKTKNHEDKDVYYSKTSLINELRTKHRYSNLRGLLTKWILNDFPEQHTWRQQIDELKQLLDLENPINQDAQDFITFDDQLLEVEESQKSITNIYQCDNGLEIEVGTIHSVKGETHDATLILETKFNRYHDLKEMLDFFIQDDTPRPIEDIDHPMKKQSICAGFLRRLYVAASRPCHLLCFAIHEDHINAEQFGKLGKKGWKLQEIKTEDF